MLQLNMFLKVKWAEKFYFVKIFKPESEEFNSNGIIVSSEYWLLATIR